MPRATERPAPRRTIPLREGAPADSETDGTTVPALYDSPPDFTVGHHPCHGIVATVAKDSTLNAWMLNGFGFHAVPDEPALFALADQARDGTARATRAVALMRNAGYDVAADLAYEPTPPAARAADRAATPSPVPTVAFAEHPQLGFIAATDDQLDSERAGRVLHERGWLHQETLDIYVLPQPDGRGPALTTLADTTLALNDRDVGIAIQPDLAQEVLAHEVWVRDESRLAPTTGPRTLPRTTPAAGPGTATAPVPPPSASSPHHR